MPFLFVLFLFLLQIWAFELYLKSGSCIYVSNLVIQNTAITKLISKTPTSTSAPISSTQIRPSIDPNLRTPTNPPLFQQGSKQIQSSLIEAPQEALLKGSTHRR